MSKLAKALLTLTAFAPVLLVYAMVSAINCEPWGSAVFIAVLFVLVFLCIIVLGFARKNLKRRDIKGLAPLFDISLSCLVFD